jgi:triacylglycerol lipase
MPRLDTYVVGTIRTALRRPGTYVGQLREAVGFARCLAHYPAGMRDAAVCCDPATGDSCHDTPVVLVHGYGHNRSAWYVVERHLRKAGFHRITSLNYNPLRDDVETIARRLRDHVELVRRLAGVDRVHVIGHSMGGIVLRWFVQELGGDEVVDTAVTIATPHAGTLSARLVTPLGPTAKQLLPGSTVLRRLEASARPTSVRWVAYYSNIDLLVQPCRSAVLDHAALGATNVLMKDHGHLSILLSPVLALSLVAHLEPAAAVPLAAA